MTSDLAGMIRHLLDLDEEMTSMKAKLREQEVTIKALQDARDKERERADRNDAEAKNLHEQEDDLRRQLTIRADALLACGWDYQEFRDWSEENILGFTAKMKASRDRDDAVAVALDDIASLCGCSHWDHPDQVVRDVQAVVDLLQQARESLGTSLRSVDEDNALGERIDMTLFGESTPHTWVTETVDGEAAGDAEFWTCSVCNASGGPVDNPAITTTLQKAFGADAGSRNFRERPFLAGPAMSLSTNCRIAAMQIANYHGRKKNEDP